MFYKARSKETGAMWDVWMTHHGGLYYLYLACDTKTDDLGANNISLATSPDGVHWTEVGPAIVRDEGKKFLGSGSTWRNPVPNATPRFQSNYSCHGPERQTIFFAQSDDLIHWAKCGPAHEFVQDERWYERNGRWDCIWTIARPGGGLYGYWTATPKAETCGRFGFGESLDGITWKALKPPYAIGVGAGEVGAIEKVGDRYIMLFGTDGRMETLIADKPQGPFKPAARNRVFLQGMPYTYFARFFQSPSGLLVCHHSVTRPWQVFCAPLKGTRFDKEGNMHLTWWSGNEALKNRPVKLTPPPANAAGPVAMLGCELDASYGFILEGTLQLPKPLGAPRGFYVEYARNAGMAILFDHTGRAEFGSVRPDGKGFAAERRVDREIHFGSSGLFRLIVKGPLLELYLNDFLIECHSLPSPATGRIGLICGDQPDSIRRLKAWENTWQKYPKDPASPSFIRKYKASPLQPPVADIAAVRPPRAGLVKLSVPFLGHGELADVRSFHGGGDGLIYLQTSARLGKACQGTLSYGADGPVKVWVNDRTVDCRPDATNPASIGKFVADVEWRKGVNRITFALSTNCGRAWGVTARVKRSRQ
jgi:hypothetical protein